MLAAAGYGSVSRRDLSPAPASSRPARSRATRRRAGEAGATSLSASRATPWVSPAKPARHLRLRCAGGGGEWPRDEPRLRRRGQVAGGHEAERGADLFAGECAQTGAAEIAIVAGRFRLFVHGAFWSVWNSGERGAIIGPFSVGSKRCRRRKLTSFRQIRTRRNVLFSALSRQGCQRVQRLLKTAHRDDAEAVRVPSRIGRVIPSDGHEKDVRARLAGAERLLLDAADRCHAAVELHLPGGRDAVAAVDLVAERLHHLQGEREAGRRAADVAGVDPYLDRQGDARRLVGREADDRVTRVQWVANRLDVQRQFLRATLDTDCHDGPRMNQR